MIRDIAVALRKELREAYKTIDEQKELIENLTMIKDIACDRLVFDRCECGAINEKGYICRDCGKDY